MLLTKLLVKAYCFWPAQFRSNCLLPICFWPNSFVLVKFLLATFILAKFILVDCFWSYCFWLNYFIPKCFRPLTFSPSFFWVKFILTKWLSATFCLAKLLLVLGSFHFGQNACCLCICFSQNYLQDVLCFLYEALPNTILVTAILNKLNFEGVFI